MLLLISFLLVTLFCKHKELHIYPNPGLVLK